MLLPISLTAAGALALLHLWLAVRVSQVRGKTGILIGDGGNEAMTRRMRAHGNFIENAPLFLILLVLLELAGAWSLGLWAATILFTLARICHAFGMDRPGNKLALRAVGVATSFLLLLLLAGWAITLTYVGGNEPAIRFEAPAVKG